LKTPSQRYRMIDFRSWHFLTLNGPSGWPRVKVAASTIQHCKEMNLHLGQRDTLKLNFPLCAL